MVLRGAMPCSVVLLVGMLVGAFGMLVLQTFGGATSSAGLERKFFEARNTIDVLRRQLTAAQRLPKAEAAPAVTPTAAATPAAAAVPSTAPQRWDDTPNNRRLRDTLMRSANARGEVMLAIANDVMMCTNRKTCWWNGGNVLETFLKASSRLKLRNVRGASGSFGLGALGRGGDGSSLACAGRRHHAR
jgi:hypothetical protein